MSSLEDPVDRSRLLDELSRTFTRALLRGDDAGAEMLFREALEAGVSEGTLDDQVIAPALRRIGSMWERGELAVHQEHLATEIVQRVVTLRREAVRVIRLRSSRTVVLAGVQGEHHVVGLRMVASLLVHAGYDVRMLGPDLPTAELPAVMALHRPAVVGLTATMPRSAAELLPAVELIQSCDPHAAVLLGGAAIPSRLDGRPAVALCPGVGDVVARVDALVQRADLN